jgi:hypothetical protein
LALQTQAHQNENNQVLSSRTRVLLVCIASFVGVVGSLGMGIGFALLPAVLIIGAIVQSRFRHLGRGLICFGAIMTSGIVFAVGIFTVPEIHTGDLPGRLALVAASVILMILCDWVILVNELRMRRSAKVSALSTDRERP